MAICNGDKFSNEENVQNLKVRQQEQQQEQEQEQLPAFELALYLAGFIISSVASGYAFYTEVSHENLLHLDSTIISEGYFGYKRDHTFSDLHNFVTNFVPMVLMYLGLVVASQISIRFCSLQVHHLVCALVTIAVSCNVLSLRCTALYLTLHCCTLLGACTGSRLVVWSVVLLAFFRFSGSAFGGIRTLRENLHLEDEGAHLFYPICGYLYCRFLAMGLYLCDKSRGVDFATAVLANLPASLHYTLYLPNFLGGPMLTMEEFLIQRQQRPQKPLPVGQFLFRLFRLLLWLGVTIATVHWLPVGAYLETLVIRIMRQQDTLSYGHVAFALYARGIMFMMEYVQYYGWPALFAWLDGIQLPHWPACILRITSFREMWRLFDRGLFAVVKQHIYIPLGGSRNGIARQLVATVATFMFICIYHGNYRSVQLWILLNLILVILELLIIKIYKSRLEAQLLKRFSRRWVRRIVGVAAVVNIMPPSFGIFYFLYGTSGGNHIMRELVWKPLTGEASIRSFAIIFTLFYFWIQLAIEYKLRRSDKDL